MAQSTITQQDFLHIAKLSRLEITPEEDYIKDQLAQAVNYIDVLNELKTDNINPTFQVNHKTSVLRDDLVSASFSQEEALSQAKNTYNGYFKTQATIKK